MNLPGCFSRNLARLLMVVSVLFAPLGCLGGDASPKEVARISFLPNNQVLSEEVIAVAFSADGKRLLIGTRTSPVDQRAGWAGRLVVWDTASHQEIASFLQEAPVQALAVCPKRGIAAVGCGMYAVDGKETGYLVLYDLQTNKELKRRSLEGNVHAVGFSPTGESLAVSSGGSAAVPSGKVTLCDPKELVQTRQFEAPGFVLAIAFSHTGKTLAVGRVVAPDLIRFFDVETGGQTRPMDVQAGGVKKMLFLPGDKEMVVVTGPGVLTIWDIANGQERKVAGLSECYGGGGGLSLSRDGSLLAVNYNLSGSHKFSCVRIWDLKTDKKQVEWKEENMRFTSLAFSPDGKLLAGGGPGIAKIWSLR